MNLTAFNPNGFRCYRCGKEGHSARWCKNQPAPTDERQRNRDGQAQAKPEGPAPQTAQPIGVHQAESSKHTQDGEEEWKFGDENIEVKESYACEFCVEKDDEWTTEDEASAAGKRTAIEMESEDEGEEEESQERPPPKARKTVGWSDGTPLDMRPTSRESTSTPQATRQDNPPLRAQRLAPSLKKGGKKAIGPQKGAPPILKPKGMGAQEAWSADQWIQNAKIEITIAQLMQIAPRARTSVVDAIRLEPNPNRKSAQKKRTTVVIEDNNQVEEASQAQIRRYPNHNRAHSEDFDIIKKLITKKG